MRTFCLAYVGETKGNGVEAARIAKYKGNEVTLAAVAYENLRKPQIVNFISELRTEAEENATGKILTATETLVNISRIAESDIADIFPDNVFLQEAKRLGVSRQIKSITFDKDSKVTKLEMYSAQTSLQDLGKHHGLFPTKIELTTNEADRLVDDAAKKHGLPIPETFGGEPVLRSEM